jgi:hypothetical protein
MRRTRAGTVDIRVAGSSDMRPIASAMLLLAGVTLAD